MRRVLVPTDLSATGWLVTDIVMRRAPVPVVVSAGLSQMSASGCWKATRHPHEQDIPQEGAWREEYSLVTMATPIQTPQ
jgi:hypothetical protein